MYKVRVLALAIALLLMISVIGCASTPAPTPPRAPAAVPTATAAPTAAPTATPEIITQDFEDFNPSNFKRSHIVDNPWSPLKPGMQFVYNGFSDRDGERAVRRVVITVTDLTKVIGGVRSLITYDLDYSSGHLVEAELAFYAQDDDGTVWRMGEYPEEYEDGKFVNAPTWIHGLDNARAGIRMYKEPKVGTRSYSQGWGPAVDFTDRGRVAEIGKRICIPFDCYNDVLLIEESSRKEPNAFQLKYYARGVGNIHVAWKGQDIRKENLDLIDYFQLSPKTMAEIRAEAIKLDKHGIEVSAMYSQLPPVE